MGDVSTSTAHDLRLVKRLLWASVSNKLKPEERDEVRKIIGTLVIEANEDLYNEASAYADILGDIQLNNVALLSRHQLCSNLQRKLVEGEIGRLLDRLRQQSNDTPTASSVLKERDPSALIPKSNNKDKAILDYVSAMSSVVFENGRPMTPSVRPLTAAGSRPGSSASRPSSVGSGGGGGSSRAMTPPDAETSLSQVQDKLNATEVEQVADTLRKLLADEREALLADVQYLQELLDQEADLKAKASAPPPSLSDLKDYSQKLAYIVQGEEVRIRHETRVSAMFSAADGCNGRASRLRSMAEVSRSMDLTGASGSGSEIPAESEISILSPPRSTAAQSQVQRLVVHGDAPVPPTDSLLRASIRGPPLQLRDSAAIRDAAAAVTAAAAASALSPPFLPALSVGRLRPTSAASIASISSVMSASEPPDPAVGSISSISPAKIGISPLNLRSRLSLISKEGGAGASDALLSSTNFSDGDVGSRSVFQTSSSAHASTSDEEMLASKRCSASRPASAEARELYRRSESIGASKTSSLTNASLDSENNHAAGAANAPTADLTTGTAGRRPPSASRRRPLLPSSSPPPPQTAPVQAEPRNNSSSGGMSLSARLAPVETTSEQLLERAAGGSSLLQDAVGDRQTDVSYRLTAAVKPLPGSISASSSFVLGSRSSLPPSSSSSSTHPSVLGSTSNALAASGAVDRKERRSSAGVVSTDENGLSGRRFAADRASSGTSQDGRAGMTSTKSSIVKSRSGPCADDGGDARNVERNGDRRSGLPPRPGSAQAHRALDEEIEAALSGGVASILAKNKYAVQPPAAGPS